MNSPDPASLQNLNDIVMPADVGWWPLAGGWYVLLAILLLALSWSIFRALKRHRANRYRRVALQELQSLTRESPHTGLGQIPILMKRVALSAYERGEVASLSGPDWHRFLDSKLKQPLFTGALGEALDQLAYSPQPAGQSDVQATAALIDACRYWLRHHRAENGGVG